MQSRVSRLTHKYHIGIGRGSRGARASAGKLVLIALVCLLALLPAAGVMAQGFEESRGSFGLPTMMPTQSVNGAAAGSAAASEWEMPTVIVDTDTGVDDAAALAWLFTQAGDDPSEILGIVTVAGNTSVENATENVLLMLATTPWNPADWPAVVRGASKPLNVKLSSTPKLWHGTDGLGYARYWMRDNAGWDPTPLLGFVQNDARSFYCSSAPATVVAMGPLTNIAKAVKKCPDVMRTHRYVVLGGAKGSGNHTVAAEYNLWQDPKAAITVLDAGLNITLVTREEFDTFTLSINDVDRLLRDPFGDQWGFTSNLVGAALCWYVGIQSTDFATGDLWDFLPVAVPDPAAMMYALDPTYSGPSWVTGESPVIAPALVEVIKNPELLQGQSLIGYFYPYPEALTMEVRDKKITKVIDEGLEGVEDPYSASVQIGDIYAQMQTMQAEIEPNAAIVQMLNGAEMAEDFLTTLGAPVGQHGRCFPESGVTDAAALSSLRYGGLLVPEFDFEDTTDTTLHLPILSR